MSKVKSTRVSGTKEWSKHSVNCISGCAHNCRYCYARSMAHRFGRISSHNEWVNMQVRPIEVNRPRHKLDGRVMCPTTHDITPETLAPCKVVLKKLLVAGNDVLIVSKPHLTCIEAICRAFKQYSKQILFRFTIGARNNDLLSYWEPGAPPYEERLACLRLAYEEGYATSVSCEPLLDVKDVVGLCKDLAQYVTDSIWIGKMNKVDTRVVPNTADIQKERIKKYQTKEYVFWVYEQLKNNPLIKWKESYKEVLGIALASRSGLDL